MIVPSVHDQDADHPQEIPMTMLSKHSCSLSSNNESVAGLTRVAVKINYNKLKLASNKVSASMWFDC